MELKSTTFDQQIQQGHLNAHRVEAVCRSLMYCAGAFLAFVVAFKIGT